MKCVNCGIDTETPMLFKFGYFCSKLCRDRNACKRFYKKYHEQQKKRVLNNFYKYAETNEGRNHIREVNLRANAKRRFGVSDRQEILSKYGFRCVFCGKKATRNKLAIHHVDNNGRNTKLPNNDINNLVSCCPSCHSKIHFHKQKLKMKI